jgi:hypothetical protein
VGGFVPLVTLIDREFIVNASLERAWQYLVRLDQWPTWAHHIRLIETRPKGELGPQSSGVIHLANGVKSTFRMTEFNLYRNWKWTGPFLWLTIDYDHRFASISSGQSKVRFVLQASGFAVNSLGRVFARIYYQKLKKAIPRLVKNIESGEEQVHRPLT